MISARGDDRRQEFLKVALNLFYEKGYEQTTIKDIIKEVGLSKGAFYHYFESKEDLLDSIAKDYARRAIQIVRDITRRDDLTAIEKINTMIAAVNSYKGGEEEKRRKIKGIFINDGNLKLEKRISKKLRESMVGFIEEIIQTAVREGTVKTSYPKELAAFTLFMMNNLNSSIDELILEHTVYEGEKEREGFLKELEEKLSFYEEIFCRLYQLKGGSIHLRDPYIKRFKKTNSV